MSKGNAILKEGFDRVASATLLLLFSPVILILALCIKLGDGGSVLFVQERVGRGGNPFQLLKLRSMRARKEGDETEVTAADNDRITPVGKFIRKSKLDELPQLWNILKGEMSFVGPRPEVPRYVSHYSDEEKRVLQVKPGLTDPATMKFRNEEELLEGKEDPESFYLETILPEKLSLSREYADRATFLSDLKVLFQTFFRVLGVENK